MGAECPQWKNHQKWKQQEQQHAALGQGTDGNHLATGTGMEPAQQQQQLPRAKEINGSSPTKEYATGMLGFASVRTLREIFRGLLEALNVGRDSLLFSNEMVFTGEVFM
jgi:hypothetical protein